MLVRSLSCHYSVSGNDSGFSDVGTGAWYSEYITFAMRNNWINGYSDGTFHPDAPITRAEAAKILSEAIDLPAVEHPDASFIDVPVHSPFAPYIYRLKQK